MEYNDATLPPLTDDQLGLVFIPPAAQQPVVAEELLVTASKDLLQ